MEYEKWCPQAAMKAYLFTLHLCREAKGEDERSSRSVVAEPECMEFISALAAGNGARLIMEIASKMTPLTIALAVAAKQTGGQLVCALPTQQQVEKCKGYISAIRPYSDLKDVIKFASGDPCEAIRSLGDQKVDFAVINREFEEHLQLLEIMRKHRGGGSIVVERLERSSKGREVSSFGEAVRGGEGIKSVSLPVSGGMELTRIENNGVKSTAAADHNKMGSEKRRRCGTRFLVIVEAR